MQAVIETITKSILQINAGENPDYIQIRKDLLSAGLKEDPKAQFDPRLETGYYEQDRPAL